jgi:hypothetical protein
MLIELTPVPFYNSSTGIRGPPVVYIKILEVNGNYFDFYESTEQKRLRTTALLRPLPPIKHFDTIVLFSV